ncbi:MAG: ABC transporter permease [Mycobacteriales bacterium]
MTTATMISGPTWAHRIARARETPVVVVLLAVVAGTSMVNSRFVSRQGIRDLLLAVSFIALMAVGQTFVIVMRHVDLSVGSTLGLASYVGVLAMRNFPGVPLFWLFLAGALVGLAVGLVNGVLVALLKLPALVVTLGTLYVVQGIQAVVVASKRINAVDLPKSVVDLGIHSVLGIPYLMWIVIFVAAVATPIARHTSFGRDLYAMGSNPDAAQLVGIPVPVRTIGAFMISGLCAGLAGALSLSRFGGTDVNAGIGLELSVVAACVIGGVFIFGGSGSPFGAVIGALLLKVIGTALPALKINAFWQDAIIGGLIIAAISVDRIAVVRADRKRRLESRR